MLFSRSFYYTEIPQDWKDGNVVPISKGGNKSDPGNYRPVSLTSLVGKVFERLLKSEIQVHLEGQKVLNDTQHGFRNGKSCLTNLLSFMDFTTGEMDKGKKLNIAYLDFAKAFDTVPHQRLLIKLEQHGIDSLLLRWIGNWLSGRKQRVILNGTKSSWIDVLSGVPQGSVLGPILFIVFVNDIDNNLMSKIWKFADDIKIATTIETEMDRDALQSDLDTIWKWTNDWQMRLNISKCKIINVGLDSTHQYNLNENSLQVVREERDLGVMVTDNMEGSRQCEEARKKALKMLGVINRNVNYKSKTVIKRLYCAYVRPHLEYCVQAWHPLYKKDLISLEKVQRRATRMIRGFKNISYEERLKSLKLHSVKYRFLRADLIEVFKILKSGETSDLTEMFKLNSSRTRGNGLKLKKEYVKTAQRLNFFSQRIINEWNSLPENVVSSSSLFKFRKELDKHFTSRKIIFDIYEYA